MSDAVLVNVLQQLQEEPQRYRLFGIYWWRIKAMLKGAGLGPAELYMLGDYVDHDMVDLVPDGLSDQDVLAEALAEYEQNARYPHADGMVEDNNGEMVRIFDEDAAL